MNVSLNIIGNNRCTLTVPMPKGGDPIREMRKANKRIAQQGARQVSLAPNRSGEGWHKTDGLSTQGVC